MCERFSSLKECLKCPKSEESFYNIILLPSIYRLFKLHCRRFRKAEPMCFPEYIYAPEWDCPVLQGGLNTQVPGVPQELPSARHRLAGKTGNWYQKVCITQQ